MVEGFGRPASQAGFWFNWGDEINWLGDECGVDGGRCSTAKSSRNIFDKFVREYSVVVSEGS